MAIYFDRGAGSTYKYLRGSCPNLHATDWTLFRVRFKVDDATDRHTIFYARTDDPESSIYALVARGDLAGDPVQFVSQRSGTNYTVDSSGSFTAGVWHDVLCMANRDNANLYISLDRAAWDYTPGAKFPKGTWDTFTVAGDNAFIPCAIGSVAELSIWTTGLYTPSHFHAYAGAHLLKPNYLQAYWPLVNLDNLQDIVGGRTLSAYNSPASSEHCRVLL